ncbi:GATA zinc finger domain-containing protein 3-like [Rhopalosiphum maidis]|uniref:GATA zinc finger domain-containing protein 3-like n=1 Tax=Rhopalosiphum maidis TaxID=43146 RepID=UPI000F0085F1|nr:GATA zinc finger domain-containing protein 3-like [Rhopalosiphum maidis]
MPKNSKTVTQKMSHQLVTNKEVHNLSMNNDNNKLIINSVRSMNYLGSDNRQLPAKKRQIMYDEFPNSERQHIQDINKISIAKTDGIEDNYGNDDNFHFLMSLLPYLREVPRNRKMAIRNKLQRVFAEEQDVANNIYSNNAKNDNNNGNNINNNFYLPRPPLYTSGVEEQQQLQLPTLKPPPPYPYANVQPVPGVDVSNNFAASTALPNPAIASAPYGDMNFMQPNLEYANNLTGQQQLQQYINNAASDNNCYGQNTNAIDNTSFLFQPEKPTFTYLQ